MSQLHALRELGYLSFLVEGRLSGYILHVGSRNYTHVCKLDWTYILGIVSILLYSTQILHVKLRVNK